MDRIIDKTVVRREVISPAKPPGNVFVASFDLKEPKVRVRCGRIGIAGMNNERQRYGKNRNPANSGRLSVAAFGRAAPIECEKFTAAFSTTFPLDMIRGEEATIRTHILIFSKTNATIDLFEHDADAFLKVLKMCPHLMRFDATAALPFFI